MGSGGEGKQETSIWTLTPSHLAHTGELNIQSSNSPFDRHQLPPLLLFQGQAEPTMAEPAVRPGQERNSRLLFAMDSSACY